MNRGRYELESWERRELGRLAPAIDELRRQRNACPPARALSASAAGALPDEAQAAVEAHVASCEQCRELQADLAYLEPADIGSRAATRILEHVRRQAAQSDRPHRVGWRVLVPISIAASILLMIGIAGYRTGPRVSPAAASQPPAVAAAQPPEAAPPAPPAAVAIPGPPLEKPAVKLTMLALTWRGASDGKNFAEDIAPALDAFRADQFDKADRELSALVDRYPASVEIPFYQGVSRLFLDRPAGAVGPLRRASRTADETFASDAAWYLGLALQRAGHVTEAHARFAALCRESTPYAERACAASRLLVPGTPQDVR